MKSQNTARRSISLVLVAALVTMVGLAPIVAQVRAGRRGAVAKGDNGAVAAGPRGAAVKGEEGYAAAGRRGAVVSGEEGYAAVGRNGNVVTGEEVDVQGGGSRPPRRGRRRRRRGRGRGPLRRRRRRRSLRELRRVEGRGCGRRRHRHRHDAGETAGRRGDRRRHPRSTYSITTACIYTKVMSSGAVVYQVVEPPAGAIITTLPAGCKSVRVGNAAYSQCGATYYTKVSTGYQVVVLK